MRAFCNTHSDFLLEKTGKNFENIGQTGKVLMKKKWSTRKTCCIFLEAIVVMDYARQIYHIKVFF